MTYQRRKVLQVGRDGVIREVYEWFEPTGTHTEDTVTIPREYGEDFSGRYLKMALEGRKIMKEAERVTRIVEEESKRRQREFDRFEREVKEQDERLKRQFRKFEFG